MTLRFNGGINTRVSLLTVASSGTQSDSIDMDGESVTAILCPSALTSSYLTFQHSDDGVTWYDAYDSGGIKFVITIGTDRLIILSPQDLTFPGRMRIVCGAAEAAQRTFNLYTRTYT